MPALTTHLYVIRHAVAEDHAADGGGDFDRRLTKKGRRKFERLVCRLQAAGLDVDLIATSPLVRTRQTAEILADAFAGRPPVVVVDALAPGSDWQALVAWTIRQDAGRVAWVGHAPCVGRLVALTIGDGSAAIRMQKGAVAAIRLDDGPGQPGELEWLATTDLADDD
jgi:phosphohistidine phosphatase